MGFEDGDDDSTDDEALTSHVYMAKTIHMPKSTEAAESSDGNEPILKVRAHLEYSHKEWYPNKVYAISDGGADSCIVGKHAKVLSYTGRYAIYKAMILKTPQPRMSQL